LHDARVVGTRNPPSFAVVVAVVIVVVVAS